MENLLFGDSVTVKESNNLINISNTIPGRFLLKNLGKGFFTAPIDVLGFKSFSMEHFLPRML